MDITAIISTTSACFDHLIERRASYGSVESMILFPVGFARFYPISSRRLKYASSSSIEILFFTVWSFSPSAIFFPLHPPPGLMKIAFQPPPPVPLPPGKQPSDFQQPINWCKRCYSHRHRNLIRVRGPPGSHNAFFPRSIASLARKNGPSRSESPFHTAQNSRSPVTRPSPEPRNACLKRLNGINAPRCMESAHTPPLTGLPRIHGPVKPVAPCMAPGRVKRMDSGTAAPPPLLNWYR